MMRIEPIIAIDGPAGSGKSTLAKLVAVELGYIHIDTGALYRSVGWKALQEGLTAESTAKAESIAQIGAFAEKINIEFRASESGSRVWIEGQDVSELIRTEEASRMASIVSAIPAVRSALLDQQRRMGGAGGAVMEGRDIGTVIFPDAEVKIFLTASESERAKRRQKELTGKGENADYETVLHDLRERDKNDSERAVAPLKKADDAKELDTSGLNIQEVLERIVEMVHDYKEVILAQRSGTHTRRSRR